MRLHKILETGGEYIPFDKTKNIAYTLGSQFVRTAVAQTGGKPNKTKRLATEMANRFLSDVMKAIDDELDYKSAPQVDMTA